MISIDKIIMFIMMVFMIIGAVDKVRNNKYGYGAEFENGIKMMGPLALSMCAIISIAPLLGEILGKMISPISSFLHIDSSIFSSLLLASDMGGYAIAANISSDSNMVLYSGIIIASVIGPTVSFLIPIAMNFLKKEDYDILAKGILTGLITAPIGCLAGGMVMSILYDISFMTILYNTLPVIIISLLIALGLKLIPNVMIHIFKIIGIAISTLIIILFALAIFQQVTGIYIPYFSVMATKDAVTGFSNLDEGLVLCGQIAIVLSGAFPMMKFVRTKLDKQLTKLAHKLKIDDLSMSNIMSSTVNCIVIFDSFNDMSKKGKYLNIAFAVSGSFVFGDLLGFCVGVESTMLLPFITAKVIASLLAIVLAEKMWKNDKTVSEVPMKEKMN